MRVRGVERQVDCSRFVVLIEHPFPCFPAIQRAEDSALRVRPEFVPQRRNQHHVRVFRVHDQPPDLPRIFQSHVRPRLPRVRGFVHAVAVGTRAANAPFPRPHVNHVGVRRRHGNRANRAHRLFVEQRCPVLSSVRRLPHAAAGPPEIKRFRIAGHARHRQRTSSAERPDEPPLHAAIERRIHAPARLRAHSRRGHQQCGKARREHGRGERRRGGTAPTPEILLHHVFPLTAEGAYPTPASHRAKARFDAELQAPGCGPSHLFKRLVERVVPGLPGIEPSTTSGL